MHSFVLKLKKSKAKESFNTKPQRRAILVQEGRGCNESEVQRKFLSYIYVLFLPTGGRHTNYTFFCRSGILHNKSNVNFPDGSVGKESTFNAGDAGDMGSIPGSGRSPEEGNGNPLQYSCHKKSHGQRSLADYSPKGHKELDTTEKN